MAHAQSVLDTLAANDKGAVQRLCDWLKIPSISTDPEYKDHVRRAAEWCAGQLRDVGFTRVEVVETGEVKNGRGAGHPVVLASVEGNASYSGPRILFYGHYDVQPVDPVDLWESPPFEPVIKPAEKGYTGAPAGNIPGERIVARARWTTRAR